MSPQEMRLHYCRNIQDVCIDCPYADKDCPVEDSIMDFMNKLQ